MGMKKHCTRPCHDCPFRRDVFPYMSKLNVLNNLKWVQDPIQNPICHQTALDGGGRNHKRLLCAGALALRIKLNLPCQWIEENGVPILKDTDSVFDTLEELAAAEAPPDVRVGNWLMNQPEPKLMRRLKGCTRGH